MNKPTPKPWIAHTNAGCQALVADQHGHPIAICGLNAYPEDRANAQAIGALPELVEALEAFCAMDWRVGPTKSEYGQAQQALMKYRGEV